MSLLCQYTGDTARFQSRQALDGSIPSSESTLEHSGSCTYAISSRCFEQGLYRSWKFITASFAVDKDFSCLQNACLDVAIVG